LSPAETSWTESVLHSFSGGADGKFPVSGVIIDPAGNLYGTTYNGWGIGTVFEMSQSRGGWTEQVIYAVETSGAGLTMDVAGNIFSVTYSEVFELSPNGNGGWAPTVIHTFTGYPKDGYYADTAPVLDKAGNLYGTTAEGGPDNGGTVYKLSPGRNGEWTEKILHSFRGFKHGNSPAAGIVFDEAGNIYGTTLWGGKHDWGTVYELVAPVGNGSYQEKILWSFTGADGLGPYAGVIMDSAGHLYGATYKGGTTYADNYGYGVVFELNPTPTVKTTNALASSPNPSTYGEAVTFTAAITFSAGTPPDGETVSFMKGKTVLGTGTLSGGSASFTISTLKVGTTSVKAVYGGDSNFGGSTSNTVKQVVEKAGVQQ
jgi:uncharacterized repeat protein (TIGR03803 family)